MFGILTYIYHKNQLNVGKYTIHGWYGYFYRGHDDLRNHQNSAWVYDGIPDTEGRGEDVFKNLYRYVLWGRDESYL